MSTLGASSSSVQLTQHGYGLTIPASELGRPHFIEPLPGAFSCHLFRQFLDGVLGGSPNTITRKFATSSIASATTNIPHLGRSRAPASATIGALKGSRNKVGKGSYATSVHIDGRCAGSEYPPRAHDEQRGCQVGGDQALWRHGRQPVLDRKLVRLWHQQEKCQARRALEVPPKRTAFQRICPRLQTCGLGVQRLHGGSL